MREAPVLAAHPRRMLGRQRELTAIDTALKRHADGAAVTLWMRGEAGIGKTRLLEELRARADARGHLVLTGRGAEFERDIPFGVWIDALDDYAGSLGVDRLERLLGDRVEELAWVLPLVPTPAGATPPTLPEERYRAHRAVRALLDAMARQRPVVVVLDDLHWADGASIELVAHLLRRPPRAPVLLALAFRTGQVPATLAGALEAATRDSQAVELTPAPLVGADAEAMLTDLRPGDRTEALRQSGGNPFYLEELSRAVRGHRLTVPSSRDCATDTPSAVSSALAREIAAFTPAARRLAQGAAIAGEPVQLDLAVAAADLTDAVAMTALDDLLGADLLRPTEVPRHYRFRHPIVRRAVYEAAGESWRLAGHARVAAALEARDASLTDRAHHLERCAQPGDESAIAVLTQAAYAVSASAPASAARWLESALRLLPAADAGDACRLELRVPLAVAQAASGQLERALATLQTVLERLPAGLPELRSGLVAACAAAENMLGRHGAAHARLLRELADLSSLEPAAAAVLQIELAADSLYDSDFDAVRAWASRAGTTAVASGDPALASAAAALECFAHYSAGDAEPAERCRADATQRLAALGDEELAGRLEAPYYLGIAEFFMERYDDAADHLERGITIARATGRGQYLVPMMIILAHARETRGHVPVAVEMAESAVDAARLSANPQVLSWALSALAWTSVVAGRRDVSAAACEEAVALLHGLDTSVVTNAIRTNVGAAWLEAGNATEGFAQLELGGAPDFPLVERGRRAWLYGSLARGELSLGHTDRAERWLARGERTLSGLQLPMAESALLFSRAALELTTDRPEAAAAHAVHAADRAAAVGARVQAARCRTLAGRALHASGDRSQAEIELQDAEAELGACGAERLREEAARELRRLGHRATARQRRAPGGAGLGALSGRERDIADLVAKGRTNQEIGDELFLAAKTVEGHLTNVFAKLGVTTRAEVAEAVGRAHREA